MITEANCPSFCPQVSSVLLPSSAPSSLLPLPSSVPSVYTCLSGCKPRYGLFAHPALLHLHLVLSGCKPRLRLRQLPQVRPWQSPLFNSVPPFRITLPSFLLPLRPSAPPSFRLTLQPSPSLLISACPPALALSPSFRFPSGPRLQPPPSFDGPASHRRFNSFILLSMAALCGSATGTSPIVLSHFADTSHQQCLNGLPRISCKHAHSSPSLKPLSLPPHLRSPSLHQSSR